VDTGTRIQLAGQGEVGSGGGPAGDLYVEVLERPHEIFTREGDDLHCTLTLPMTAAALGTSVPLDTLDGEQVIDIRPGTQSGQVITLDGRGAGRLRYASRGDLLVHVEVATPTRLDDRQRELLAELAELREESRPTGQLDQADGHGLFAKLRDAWSGR
jgi:molecular chaperone DnaJ